MRRGCTRMRSAAHALLVLALASGPAVATGFAEKPVRLVVPYPAGGSSDVIARVLSLRLAELWGQPVHVHNVPGGGSVFGTHSVASAPPDGHTLLAGNVSLAINEALSRKLPYHALRDFAPISLTARQHMALVVHAGSPFTSVGQLVEAARSKPGNVTYGSAGHGGVGHLAGELLKLVTLSNLAHVPYSGARQALTELAARHVSCAIVPLPPAIPYVKAGRLRVIALADGQRSSVLPEVPTIAESVPGYEVNNWIGVLAPYGLSVPLMRRISADLASVVNKPNFRDQLGSLGYEAVGTSPGEFHSRISGDIERYSRIVSAAGIRSY